MFEPVLPAQRRYRLATVSAPGGELAVGVWQPRTALDGPAAPTVLAIHGITGNHRCWSYLADSLQDSRVVAPDLRGRGGSAAVGPPFGLAAHADDMVRLLDALEIEQAVLVGHSMGGFVAAVAAHRHPARVHSLVLVDGGLPMTQEVPQDPATVSASATRQLEHRLAMTFRSADEAVALWRAHPAFRNEWSSVVHDYAVYDLGGEAPRLHSRARAEAMRADSDDTLFGTDLRAAFDELAHPTQWLTASRGLLGESPGLYPPDLVQHWSERYPQIEVHPVPRVNHYTIVLSRAGGEAMASAVHRSLAGHASAR